MGSRRNQKLTHNSLHGATILLVDVEEGPSFNYSRFFSTFLLPTAAIAVTVAFRRPIQLRLSA